MRFEITGADKDSGNERSIVVEADDEKAALAAGKLQGIFAYHTTVIPPLGPGSQSHRVADLEVEPPIIQRSLEMVDTRRLDHSDQTGRMKRFLIVGADEDSGQERSAIVEANDETTALHEAKRQGIFPYRHEILPDEDETPEVMERINPTPSRPLSVETIEAVAFVSTLWQAAGWIVLVLFLGWALLLLPKSWDAPSLTVPDSQPEPASPSEPNIDTARVRSRLDYVRPYIRQQQRDAALHGWDTTNIRKLSFAVDTYEREPTETNWRVVQSAADAYVQQHLRALSDEGRVVRDHKLLRMFSDDQGSIPFLDRLDASDYSSRVGEWARQFARSESWVRRYTLPSDSAEDANIKLVRQHLLEEG